MANSRLELRLLGDNVSPETVDVSDLATLLTDYKAAVVAAARNCNAGFQPQNATLALVGITKGSDRLKLASSPELIAAARAVSAAVRSDDWSSCGSEACRHVTTLTRLLRSRRWELELPSSGRGRRPTLRGDTVVSSPETYSASGETVLYGIIDTAGREKNPRLRLVLADESSVEVTGPRDEIKQLGARLFESVAIRGTATWNLETGKVTGFRLTAIEEYQETNLVDAFSKLAEAAGSQWDGVNAREFVRMSRGYDE